MESNAKIRINLFYLFTAFAVLISTYARAEDSVEVWRTTMDRASLFELQSERLHFRSPRSNAPAIEVDDSRRYQQIDGFGFALTGGSAGLLMQMDQQHRSAILHEIFGLDQNGIGVSSLRLSIGASDMNERVFTYDDLPAGQQDADLAHFSLGPDLHDVIPVVKEILAINPSLFILASPWTAPSWMKDNHLPKAGSLESRYYQAYAHYLIRYLQAMSDRGIPIRAITLQNEPLNANNTPSMVMPAAEEASFLATALGPAMQKAGLKVKVILYDHNCDRPDYPLSILADPAAAQYADGSGFHLYGGKVDAMTAVHNAYPAKNIYFTEQMVVQEDKSQPLHIAGSVADVVIGALRNWSRTVLLWNLAADSNNGPHTDDGGCPVCQGAITIDGNQVQRNLAYYTLAHASRFVRPGSIRIESGATYPDKLPNVAFSTPEHAIVLLVANPTTSAQPLNVTFHKRSFAIILQAGEVATYLWH